MSSPLSASVVQSPQREASLPAPQRDLSLDALRSLAMVYIVGFWHPLAASHLFGDLFYTNTTILLSFCFLGLFCFISGFLISKQRRAGFGSFKEVAAFYGRRVARLYPLYLLACVGFYATGLIPKEDFLAGISLSGAVRNINIMTLWFVNVIIVFYLLTPLLLFRFQWKRNLCLCLALYAVLIALAKGKCIDPRLAHYFVIYAAGVLLAQAARAQEWVRRQGWKLLPLFLIAGWLAMNKELVHGKTLRFVLTDMAVLMSMPVLLALGRFLACTLHARLISWVSYSSFALYLFHRLIFNAAHAYYLPKELGSMLLYEVGVLLPISLVIAYGIQAAYDAIHTKLASVFAGRGGAQEHRPAHREPARAYSPK